MLNLFRERFVYYVLMCVVGRGRGRGVGGSLDVLALVLVLSST